MNARQQKITYWTSTILLAAFILPGILFINQPFAIEGSAHLGIPYWLHLEIGIGKFIGGLLLVLPFIPARIKEWTYVAFGIDFLSAFIGHTATDGFTGNGVFALVLFAVLLVSYTLFHSLQKADKQVPAQA